MTELGGIQDGSEPFEVSDLPETAASQPEFQGVNVCRVAALSSMFSGDREAVGQLASELQEIGFSEALRTGQRVWSDIDARELFPDLREQGLADEGRNRVRLWQTLNETSQPQSASAFLVAVLGSELERESAAAAAALWRRIAGFDVPRGRRDPFLWEHLWHRLYDLWDLMPFTQGWMGFPWSPAAFIEVDPYGDDSQEIPWNPERWAEIYGRIVSLLIDPYVASALINLLVQWRLNWALRSLDSVTRSLAMAAFLPDDEGNADYTITPSGVATVPPEHMVSTMIHGTGAWKGGWWRPGGGDFHAFIANSHRPNLYSRGAKYSWSGNCLAGHRRLAASDFCAWASDRAPKGLQTVFGHSYGGEVAARAVLDGARVNELVLLSVPVTRHVKDAASKSGLRVVDIRLRFDPVLALTGNIRQRIPSHPNANVTTVLLKYWRLDHGATHKEHVWMQEDVAGRGGL